VHATLFELVHALSPRLLAAVVGVVDDDLPALDGEEVPDLVLQLILDPST